MSQILFLDTPENFSNLILKKKISVKNGYFWNFLELFWNFLERNGLKWVKNGGLKANTTSASSKEDHGFDTSVGANPALTGGQKSQT